MDSESQDHVNEVPLPSEERWRIFVATAFEGLIVTIDGVVVEANERFLQMSGYQLPALRGRRFEQFVVPDDRTTVVAAIRSGRELAYEVRFVHASGNLMDLEVRSTNSLWDGQKARIAAVRDVTERKRGERELRRLNGLYKMLSRVNDAAARTQTREQLFHELSHSAVGCGGFGIAWVGWLDAATGQARPMVVALGAEEDREKAEAALEACRGEIGSIISAGEAFACNGVLAEARLQPWHELALSRGFSSIGVFPIRISGAVVGALVVHGREKDFFHGSETELLREVSASASFALHRFELEAEKKRMDDALRESEYWLRQSQRVARMGSCVVDLQTRLMTVSPMLREIVGLGPTDGVDPGSWGGIVHPEDWPRVRDYALAMIAQTPSSQPGAIEYRIIRRNDRQERWAQGRIEVVVDESGQSIRLQGVVLDITERKRAEEDLRSSRKRLMEIIESTPAGYFHVTADKRYQHVNVAWLQMHGFSCLEEVVGQAFSVTQTETDLKASEAIADRVLAGEAISSCEMSRRLKNGLTAYHSFSARPVFQVGEVIGFEGFLIDTTQLRRTHELLLQRERHYRSLIENSSDVITMLTADGVITYESPSVKRLFGYDADALVGHNILEYVHEADQADLGKAIRHLTPDSTGQAVFRLRHKDGSWRTLEMVGQRQSAETHGEPAIVANMRDITERVQLEHQLRQAQKMEAIGQLVGGVAHDFNNILTAVLLHLGLLQGEPGLEEQTKSSLRELERATLRATSLTRQLLVFSRKQAAHVQVLDLDQSLQNLLKMLQRVLGETVELLVHQTAGGAWVKADPGMMEQVVMNLCINARDAMPQGGRLEIGTSAVEFSADGDGTRAQVRPGRFVCLAVTDTGCGMSQEVVERIFEPFFTTKDPGKGTGLGLAMVYGIVKQHEGWIDVASTVGQGSRFRIYLPAWSGPREADSGLVPPRECPQGSETILLVEDDPSVRRSVALQLRRLGYAVLEAANGAEAIDLWKAHRSQIALLLSDMVMPGGIGGAELATLLRREKPALKVIISSGYSSHNASLPGQAGGDGFRQLGKPYEAASLAKAVRECLDSRV
jgi:PAS domain S-box-containing protein